jgi:CubicO group peptidase (beta-lactamase class C family)
MHLNRTMAIVILVVCASCSSGQDALWPSPDWESATPQSVGLDGSKLDEAKRYALSAGGSGIIIRHGRVALRWGDQKRKYDIKSSTKSFGATMLGMAIKDGKIRLDHPAVRYHRSFGTPPKENGNSGWLEKITVRHLATQTAGFAKGGGYERLLFEPGSMWHYSDGGPNWLAECITLQYGRDLAEVLFDRLCKPIGIGRDDLRWRKNQYREPEIQGVARREFGAGIHCNVEALSRVAYLYLHNGYWNGQQLLPDGFVELATGTIDSVVGLPEFDNTHDNASDHYGLLWWNNADGTLPNIPRDAFWSWGLYDSLMIVMPSLDMVVVRAGERGRQWRRNAGAGHYDVLAPFLDPIVAATGQSVAPYAPSKLIIGVRWEPSRNVLRLADGSDNWPATWGEDDSIYTAYGDGWGFRPRVEEKLSLGLAKVCGHPPDISGINLRSDRVERRGQGPKGVKASGMLMVEGVLYLLTRNADNSQLAWSNDQGKSWTWAPWKWTTSFGCPTFLNFGKNYGGARDEFIYVYSPDSDSAYEPADQMVMARAHKTKIGTKSAYEYFGGLDQQGSPIWTPDIDKRTGVFRHFGRCYRSGITYNPGIKRYLWCQTLPESSDSRGPRFEGGFGIYEGPEPWGPWSTVYFTNHWDMGPGETSSFPTKWISADGHSLHLLFSGNDCFSVRKVILETR